MMSAINVDSSSTTFASLDVDVPDRPELEPHFDPDEYEDANVAGDDYRRAELEAFFEDEYPDLKTHFVEQERQIGTADAIGLARPYVDGPVLIVFVDTLFDADLSLVKRLPEDEAGVIWAKEVEDYQRFGVIVTDDDGYMKQIIEKPKDPISKLANIGLYYIRDWKTLFEGIDETLESTLGPGGEYYLTDAFQYMIDQGAKIRTERVEGWYDCGKPGTLLETNEHLLENVGRDVAAVATDFIENAFNSLFHGIAGFSTGRGC